MTLAGGPRNQGSKLRHAGLDIEKDRKGEFPQAAAGFKHHKWYRDSGLTRMGVVPSPSFPIVLSSCLPESAADLRLAPGAWQELRRRI